LILTVDGEGLATRLSVVDGENEQVNVSLLKLLELALVAYQ